VSAAAAAPDRLAVLYRDADFVAVHKPAGMPVHRTGLSLVREVVLQRLRDQLSQRVYPVHRLDHATSGVLVLALGPEAARRFGELAAEGAVRKRYWAIVRGLTAREGEIDHPLADLDNGVRRPALTRYRTLASVELPLQVGRYPTARYSLVEVAPVTGRQHQIRRHFKHISHPLIGDTTYGRGEHNRLFRELTGLQRLWLLARRLCFTQPFDGRRVDVTAEPETEWAAIFERFGWRAEATSDGVDQRCD
jgi:tRNA pseudouridine65 synthase